MPPYFKQTNKYACSLAVLRSVLAVHGIQVSEEELVAKVEKDYGSTFKNLWNPTVAKLARQYSIDTHMYALWPLFKPELLQRALQEYNNNPDTMDVRKYENPNDQDDLAEPLPLAYKEIFEALKLGCKLTYGQLTEHRLQALLDTGYLVQTSIRNAVLYPETQGGYHSLLIYGLRNGIVAYHDPLRGPAMTCSVQKLLQAANGTGAFIAFK